MNKYYYHYCIGC